MVGLKDLEGLFEPKWFYDSYVLCALDPNFENFKRV